jgi:hypothetical protein
MKKYPHEFLGRCQTCLDNAYLSAKPCTIGYGQGMPLSDRDCMIRRAQAEYDKEHGK